MDSALSEVEVQCNTGINGSFPLKTPMAPCGLLHQMLLLSLRLCVVASLREKKCSYIEQSTSLKSNQINFTQRRKGAT